MDRQVGLYFVVRISDSGCRILEVRGIVYLPVLLARWSCFYIVRASLTSKQVLLV